MMLSLFDCQTIFIDRSGTDIKITLIAGKAHLKHTEGGDFRQATYRAVRHGLRRAKSVLLEPIYDFRLEVPQGCVGRALTDIQRLGGQSELPDVDGDMAVITGCCPVATMSDYQKELVAYTSGKGKIFLTVKGYDDKILYLLIKLVIAIFLRAENLS